MPKYIPLVIEPEIKTSLSDLLEFHWKVRAVKATFIMPARPDAALEVSFAVSVSSDSWTRCRFPLKRMMRKTRCFIVDRIRTGQETCLARWLASQSKRSIIRVDLVIERVAAHVLDALIRAVHGDRPTIADVRRAEAEDVEALPRAEAESHIGAAPVRDLLL